MKVMKGVQELEYYANLSAPVLAFYVRKKHAFGVLQLNFG